MHMYNATVARVVCGHDAVDKRDASASRMDVQSGYIRTVYRRLVRLLRRVWLRENVRKTSKFKFRTGKSVVIYMRPVHRTTELNKRSEHENAIVLVK